MPIWRTSSSPRSRQRTGAKFEYVPILLGGVFKLTNNRSPAESMRGIKNRLEYEELETAALRPAPRHHAVHLQPVLPGQHASDHARRGRGAARRRVRPLRRRGVPPHVGRAEEDGRSRGGACGARAIRSERRRPAGAHAGARGQGRACSRTPKRALPAAPSAARPSSSASEIFFGKDRLRDVEEELVRAKT